MELRTRKKFVLLAVSAAGLSVVTSELFNSANDALKSVKKTGTYLALYADEVYEPKVEVNQDPAAKVFASEDLEIYNASKERAKHFADMIIKNTIMPRDITPDFRRYVAYEIASNPDTYQVLQQSLMQGNFPNGDQENNFVDTIQDYYGKINGTGDNSQGGQTSPGL